MRLLSTMVAYNALGTLMVAISFGAAGVFMAIVVDSFDTPTYRATAASVKLRALVAKAVVALLCEITYMRTVVIPFFQHHEIGVALFVIEIWYLHIGLLKGVTRLATAFQNVILSSFTPHACIFPDGMEASDTAHVAFVCYVMERVRQVWAATVAS